MTAVQAVRRRISEIARQTGLPVSIVRYYIEAGLLEADLCDEDIQATLRRARRIAHDLGVNMAGVEVILRLRRQVLDLQARVAQLEAELAAERACRRMRLRALHDDLVDAMWREIAEEGR